MSPSRAFLYSAFRCSVAAGLSLGLCAGACSSARFNREEGTLSFPAKVAEGSEQASDGGGDAEQALATPEHEPKGSLPDPAALKEARHWEYELLYDRGKVSVHSVRALRFEKPVPTVRTMGRWAFELWIGKELVERVRFDFPLLGAEEARTSPRHPLHEPPSLAEGATVTRRILIPDSQRATRAVLVDRATGDSIDLPWPPNAPLGPPRTQAPASARADAGVDAS